MTLLLAGAIFLCKPYLYKMPQASAYLVREGDVRMLEDRYDVNDQWLARSLLGSWSDGDGRAFELYSLDSAVPALEGVKTREEFVGSLVKIGRRDREKRTAATVALLPESCVAEPKRLRQLPRQCKDLVYYPSTNNSAIAVAFLPKESETWLLALWTLAEGDDYDAKMGEFIDKFLGEELKGVSVLVHAPTPEGAKERELLRADARHSVTNHHEWHCTEGEEFTVLDNLGARRDFVTAFTNDLKTMRRRYAETMPSPLCSSNVLCVARIYSTREQYLDAVDDGMEWTAAYWSPSRRELVAHLPASGEGKLLETLRHEAFHQYLSYATAMIPASPWINEGYAQLFEDEKRCGWKPVNKEDAEALAKLLPLVFNSDYAEFYSGSDEERALKYRLAWSIAYFIENGAPKVRFAPFKDLKKRYIEVLLETQYMRVATARAFENEDKFKLFLSEWKKFWLEQ